MKTTELIKSPCMIAVCSFCRKFIGFRPVEKGDKMNGQLTHGICERCLKNEMAKLTPVPGELL